MSNSERAPEGQKIFPPEQWTIEVPVGPESFMRRAAKRAERSENEQPCQGRLKTDPLAPVENGPPQTGPAPVENWSTQAESR